MSKTTYEFEDIKTLPQIYGEHNAHLKQIEKQLDVEIIAKSNQCDVSGSKKSIDLTINILKQLEQYASEDKNIDLEVVKSILRFAMDDKKPEQIKDSEINTAKGSIAPRNPKQKELIEAVKNHDVTFALGPAGTGKTYLAVALAVEMFLNGSVERIVFCRPAVEAGERLGFLPGDMEEKIAPYLKPMHDALFDMMYADKIEKARERNQIEIAPLAFMRGRTLNNAAIVLDEAQNTTPLQMKMFLTRLGNNSKMIISGDPSQADLPPTVDSGLSDATHTLKDVHGLKFITFTNKDVVRHDMVAKILNAYDSKR